MCNPIRSLIHKNVVWRWTHKHEEVFSKIKESISEAPVMRYFDSKLKTTLQCDASSNGLGATLLQQGQPIAYARRAQTLKNNSQETSDLRPKTPSTHVFETSEVWNWDHVQARQGNVRGRRSVQSSSQETVQRSLYRGSLQDIWRYQHGGIPPNFTNNNVEDSTDQWRNTRVAEENYPWRMAEV